MTIQTLNQTLVVQMIDDIVNCGDDYAVDGEGNYNEGNDYAR